MSLCLTGFFKEDWYDAVCYKRISGGRLYADKNISDVRCALCGLHCRGRRDDSYDKLYSAIRANDLRQIKALLDEGVSANAEGPDGITPLMVAAETGSLDAMKMLIDRRRRRQREEHVRDPPL